MAARSAACALWAASRLEQRAGAGGAVVAAATTAALYEAAGRTCVSMNEVEGGMVFAALERYGAEAASTPLAPELLDRFDAACERTAGAARPRTVANCMRAYGGPSRATRPRSVI